MNCSKRVLESSFDILKILEVAPVYSNNNSEHCSAIDSVSSI